ncbi:uncharacterized protein LOC135462944 isoform X2 [Liolophura sinensis]|uniref:uncharacterized protein LOC135462944 isoform X2 n=1 Tax=Liolophura sinensis TaxID=3198878 RepID=UPI0031596C28
MLYLLILFLALARLGEIKMFSWTRNDVNGDLVIKVNSAGNVKTGPEYNGSVELGDKCSLVFKSPGFKDNGTFAITAYNKREYSEDVQVIVVNESAKLYSNAVRQGKRNVTESETDDICVGWKAGTGICALLLCVVITSMVIYKMCHRNGTYINIVSTYRNYCVSWCTLSHLRMFMGALSRFSFLTLRRYAHRSS